MPTDRPTQTEILDAVVSFLERDLKPLVSGEKGYLLRVAVHLLRVLERELSEGARLEAIERAGLAELLSDLPEPERGVGAFAARIRGGRIAYDDPRLVDHLRRTVLAKVAIDNPRYPSLLAELAEAEDAPG